MHAINPVTVVSDFLKSEEGAALLSTLGETGRCVDIGAVDGLLIVLGKNGFRTRGNGREETATAYDVFDAVMAGQPEPSEENSAGEVFRRLLLERCATLSA